MQRLVPLFVRKLNSLKVPEDEAGRVAVAFSGGPDSTALLALTARWHQQSAIPTPPPIALVVDHQLRPGSTAEAYDAARRAEDLGLRSRVLTVDWEGAVPETQHKMHAARDARYALLLGACQREGMRHLFTAHHADDQAETFLLRFIHASGLDGLSCISPENRSYVVSHGVRLLRPLLGAHKEELLTLCKEFKLEYAEDPTNNDPSFQRNRLRQLLASSPAAEALDAAPPPFLQQHSYPGEIRPDVPLIIQDILRLQRLCSRVSTRQQYGAGQLLQRAMLHAAPSTYLVSAAQWQDTQREGRHAEYNHRQRYIHWQSQLPALSRRLGTIPHAILQARPFMAADEVTAAMAVSHLLQRVSGSEYPPGLPDCTKLARRLADGHLRGGFTGGGCTVQPMARSKGRYFLVVPQRSQADVLELLKPPTQHQQHQHKGGQLRVTVTERGEKRHAAAAG